MTNWSSYLTRITADRSEEYAMAAATMSHSYTVTGMSCDNCAQKVSAALRKVEGVITATASFNPPAAHIEMKSHVSTDALNEALSRLGAYRLTEAQDHRLPAAMTAEPSAEPPESLYPLFLIVGYIAGAVGLVSLSSGNPSIPFFMNNFMAGFFLVFSFFKLIDLRGFSDAYRSYDLLAQKMPGWGFVYPFIELSLGIAYLLDVNPFVINITTLGIMLISSIGVLRALLNKRAIRCACLGTALKLPMTKITLVEDLGMAAMAAAVLVML
jgi:copper chaperone CopZ